jgi:hypothetical protein
MRQLLLFVLMLGVLGFVTDHADAKQITVQLTKNQVMARTIARRHAAPRSNTTANLAAENKAAAERV